MAIRFQEGVAGDVNPQPVGGTTNFADLAMQYGGQVAPIGGTEGMPTAGGMAAPTEDDTPKVYVGSVQTLFPPDSEMLQLKLGDRYDDVYGERYPESARERTIEQALKKFDNMSLAEQRRMYRLLLLGGFAGSASLEDMDEIVSESSQIEARDAYANLLTVASEYYASGAQATPNDVLRSAIAYRLGGEGIQWNGKFSMFDDGIPKSLLEAAQEEETAEPFTTVTRDRSVDILNPQDAKYLTRTMLQQELGRDPTQAEYEDFISALHAAERANPTTSKTTSHYGVDETGSNYLQSQRTVTHQGIGAEGLAQVAYEKAQQNPGWAEWQAVGTYFPALLQALGATVPGA